MPPHYNNPFYSPPPYHFTKSSPQFTISSTYHQPTNPTVIKSFGRKIVEGEFQEGDVDNHRSKATVSGKFQGANVIIVPQSREGINIPSKAKPSKGKYHQVI